MNEIINWFKSLPQVAKLISGAVATVAALAVGFVVWQHFQEFNRRGQAEIILKQDVEALQKANKGWSELYDLSVKERKRLDDEIKKYGFNAAKNEQTISDLNKRLKTVVPPKPPAVKPPTPVGETEEIKSYRETLNAEASKQRQCLNKVLQGETDATNC